MYAPGYLGLKIKSLSFGRLSDSKSMGIVIAVCGVIINCFNIFMLYRIRTLSFVYTWIFDFHLFSPAMVIILFRRLIFIFILSKILTPRSSLAFKLDIKWISIVIFINSILPSTMSGIKKLRIINLFKGYLAVLISRTLIDSFIRWISKLGWSFLF